MSWTRRWGIIGSIALAQLGIIVGYQALLSGGPPVASAQTVETKAKEPPIAKEPAAMPPIPVPVVPAPAASTNTAPAPLPTEIKRAPQLLDLSPAFPLAGIPVFDPMLLPVTAKQEQVQPPTSPAPDVKELTKPPLGNAPSPGVIDLPPPKAQPETKSGPGNFSPPPMNVLPPAPLPAAKPAANCPWNLSVEIIDGRTHLTAQNGGDVTFTVSCEKLDVQTPGGLIHASGKVQLATDSIEGSCERMTISWQEDVVVLEKARLKCKLEGHEADLNAEQLRVRLSRVITVAEPQPVFSFFGGFFR